MFYHDGREWGSVRYELDVQLPAGGRIGRVAAQLRPAEPGNDPMPFFKLVEKNEALALRLDEHGGQWWLCFLSNTAGRAVSRGGGIRPAGPQPKKE